MRSPAVRRNDPDRVLDTLRAEPVRVIRPARQSVPFVFASPHSGRLYPASFIERSRLNPISLRRSEDAFVDELFGAVVAFGAPLVLARFPRAYLDANRAPGELDAAMFDGALPFAVDRSSPRVHAGLGIIPRVVREGVEIYREKLTPHEAEDRIQRFYRPYHARVERLVDETRARFGVAILVDCHSMPSCAAAPDVVLGDRLGLAAAPQVTYAAECAFAAQGFRVARNAPYAGGHTTQLYGRPGTGAHALQIEINRALYLDEERVERGPRFDDVRRRIGLALRDLIALTGRQAQSAASRLAAE
ncbi:MAG TPA: N-formylglutamate amidohydrolase [Rhizomicrobium sp.]|jgi:N-formylglutamate deformylase|nr:N-formylglutamate amidohydrolase [Rhizomicrobium sp.]